MTLAQSVAAEFAGGCWSNAEVESAVKQVLAADRPHNRCSVGTRGSTHFNEWSEPAETAEDSVAQAFRRKLAANPVLGTLDTSCRPETVQERFSRLCREVAEILNS